MRIALEVLLQHIPDYTIEPEPVRVATHIPVVFATAKAEDAQRLRDPRTRESTLKGLLADAEL